MTIELRNELKKYIETLSINQKDEMVLQIKALATAIFEAQQKFSLKSPLEANAIGVENYIKGDMSPISFPAENKYVDGIRTYDEEIEKENARYEEVLERLQFAKESELEITKEYNELIAEEEKAHEDRLFDIKTRKAGAMLGSASDMFGSLADIISKSGGEQTKAYKVMFAASKAFSLAQTLLALPTSIAEAMKMPFPANLAAAAQAGATVATQIAAVRAISFGGGRQYGGPVAANKMYRVNETGQPEIFNAANGRQFFLPNQKGDIIAAGKGAGNMAFNQALTINIDSGSGLDEVKIAKMVAEISKQETTKMIQSEFRNGGVFSRR